MRSISELYLSFLMVRNFMFNSLRFALPSDAKKLHQLIVELAIYEKEPDAVELTVDTLYQQLSSIENPFQVILAEQASKKEETKEIIGFALFFFNYSTWKGTKVLFLEDLFVTERARGQGVGGALMRELASIALEMKCTRFEWSVLKWNQGAIKFYEELGAVRKEEWVGYRLDEEALLKLVL